MEKNMAYTSTSQQADNYNQTFRMDNFQSSDVNQSIISCNENMTIVSYISVKTPS